MDGPRETTYPDERAFGGILTAPPSVWADGDDDEGGLWLGRRRDAPPPGGGEEGNTPDRSRWKGGGGGRNAGDAAICLGGLGREARCLGRRRRPHSQDGRALPDLKY